MTRPGIEPQSFGPLANTLPTWPYVHKTVSYKTLQILCLCYPDLHLYALSMTLNTLLINISNYIINISVQTLKHTHTHTYIVLYIYLYIYIYIYIYICICIWVISSQRSKTVCGLFAYRIYEEFHIHLWKCSMYGYYIFPIEVYIINVIYSVYTIQLEENPNLVKLSL